MRKLGPYSRRLCLSKIDQRTREGKLMRAVREELDAHCGGKPSAVQAAMIEQACQLTLRIAMMDRHFAELGEQTGHDSRTYLAWSNSLVRLLRDLGVKASPARTPSISDIMRSPHHGAAA